MALEEVPFNFLRFKILHLIYNKLIPFHMFLIHRRNDGVEEKPDGDSSKGCAKVKTGVRGGPRHPGIISAG